MDAKKFLRERISPRNTVLAPAKKLKIAGKSGYRHRRIRGVWNGYGGLLKRLSEILGIDPALCVAILCVESRGRGFSSDGRMIIRFENHIFWRYWGSSHPSSFFDHFKFDSHKPWRGHKFRRDGGSEWINFHRRGQPGEWEVFEFARLKHRRFSMYSISMGMPQIMGFNHKRIGYSSVKSMFDSFSRSEREQITGFFDFLEADMIDALRTKDFMDFARRYNGTGRAKIYAERIKTYYKLSRELITPCLPISS